MGGAISTLLPSAVEIGEKIDTPYGSFTYLPLRTTEGYATTRKELIERMIRKKAEDAGMSVQEYRDSLRNQYQSGELGEGDDWQAGGYSGLPETRPSPRIGVYATKPGENEYSELRIGPDEFGVSFPRIDKDLRNVGVWKPLKNPEPGVVNAPGLGVVLILAEHRLRLTGRDRAIIERRAITNPRLRVLLQPGYKEYAVQPIYPDPGKRPAGPLPVYSVPDLIEGPETTIGEPRRLVDRTLEFAVYEMTEDYVTFISSNGELTSQQTYSTVRDLISSRRGRGPAFQTAIALALTSMTEQHANFFEQVVPKKLKRVYGNDAFVIRAEIEDDDLRFV